MVFHHGGEATNSLLIEIERLQFNINLETSYVSRAQVLAVEF